jgi:DNA-binding CsgD family transcriptional regulator
MPSYYAKRVFDAKVQANREGEANRLGTLEREHKNISRLRAVVPFDQYVLSGLDYPGLGVGAGVLLASDMPEAFLRAYLTRGLYLQDPLSQLLSPSQNSASWHDLSEADRSRDEVMAISALEKEYRIKTRTGFGFYRDEVFFGGAAFTRDTPFTAAELFILEAGARMAHSELSQIYIAKMTEHARITGGEVACLKAIASGHTTDEVAELTGYTAETVSTYIKSATRKLGAENRTQAAVEAIRRRIIT